jgi:hypothetical protein
MTELWYRNPAVLFTNMQQFFPTKDLNRVDKINSLARLALYYGTLLLLLGNDKEWLVISLIILLISLFLGVSENFVSYDSKVDGRACTQPTKENPFMNYTVGDLIRNDNRPPACKYEDVKTDMRHDFRSKLHSDPNDMWGQYISDRQFYTMPNTNIVNDQMGFASACFGVSGDCKSYGRDCLKEQDIAYYSGRLTSNALVN